MATPCPNLNAMLRAVAAQELLNRLFGALMLGLRRLEQTALAPAMDPAVLDETLGYYEERNWMELESRHRDVEIVDKTCAHFEVQMNCTRIWAVGMQRSLSFLLRVRSNRRGATVCVGLLERPPELLTRREIVDFTHLPVYSHETFWLISHAPGGIKLIREIVGEYDFTTKSASQFDLRIAHPKKWSMPMFLYIQTIGANVFSLDISVAAIAD